MNELIENIRQWGREKGITGSDGKGTVEGQMLKLYEEAAELMRAHKLDDGLEFIDAVGDCMVVLTLLADLKGLKVEECVQVAYNVISKRTGHMVDGTFVKD